MLKNNYHVFLAHNFSEHQQNQVSESKEIFVPSQPNATTTAPDFVRSVANNGPKPELKKKAIALRLKGYSYSEILKIIPVAKSTLSEWFRSVKLAKRQIHILSEKKRAGQRRGALAKKEQCHVRRQEIYDKAKYQIGDLSDREVWLICVGLYWAEGGKEKSYRMGKQFDFFNTDPRMLRVMMYWLVSIVKIPIEHLKFEIYIHRNYEDRIKTIQQYWSKELEVSLENLSKIRYKKHNPKTNRKNVGNLYNGLVRVKVVSSSSLTRYLEGWVQGIEMCIAKAKSHHP